MEDFHEKFYVPHNACLIICGRLSGGTESVLAMLDREIETNFIAHGYNGGHRPRGWIRPIVETGSGSRMPHKTSRACVPIPGDKWTRGSTMMVYQGPRIEDFIDIEVSDFHNLIRLCFKFFLRHLECCPDVRCRGSGADSRLSLLFSK